MRITITARHADIPDELRARAREALERLGRMARRAQDGQVIFEGDHGGATVELRLRTVRGQPRAGGGAGGGGGGGILVASGEGPDHRTALDRAVGRLRRQLDKAAPSRRRAARRAVR
jgi:ribosome-associated translation inhibitor RaiA